MAITDDEVRARDIAAGIDKSFKLAYLELAAPQTIAGAYDPAARLDNTQTLQAALEPLAELRALGWHVDTVDTCVSVHRHHKNGKPKKGRLMRRADLDERPTGTGASSTCRRIGNRQHEPSRTSVMTAFQRIGASPTDCSTDGG